MSLSLGNSVFEGYIVASLFLSKMIQSSQYLESETRLRVTYIQCVVPPHSQLRKQKHTIPGIHTLSTQCVAHKLSTLSQGQYPPSTGYFDYPALLNLFNCMISQIVHFHAASFPSVCDLAVFSPLKVVSNINWPLGLQNKINWVPCSFIVIIGPFNFQSRCLNFHLFLLLEFQVDEESKK